ncbi:MBL fold metallo-hydrolase [Flavobacterium qiangtangense]|uniref:MBL fold metallo-hydrolase n=1 Tax=Flavobacterium qiangtangense TaxID=1442595 RepID=A0ABW1PLG9_9FLAO
MSFTIILLILLSISIFLFFNQPKFGRRPSGNRLDNIKHTSNFKNGQFQNVSITPDLAEGANYYTVLKEFFFGKSKRNVPKGIIPSVKTNLKNLDPNRDILVWFGHSSYFMQLSGKTFLVDPVFSNHASPLSFTVNAFKGSNVYRAEDFPEIDFLIVTHDHWDHLDYDTVLKLKPKVKRIVTSLGTGEHFERWNFDMEKVSEMNWHEELIFGDFKFNAVPARHFSGRGLKRNQAIWISIVLNTPTRNIYIGGDSGYDTFFKTIGDLFGPFDLAILECGQYNKNWKYIHMMPEETVQASKDLKAKVLMPVHWAKFPLALHDWDDPIIRADKAASIENVNLTHPMIGEILDFDNLGTTKKWWEGIE